MWSSNFRRSRHDKKEEAKRRNEGAYDKGNFAPYRATSPPDQRERTKMSKISGSSAPPASVAEYPSI